MAVPYNYTDVGWFRYGPIPGQIGSAVFDGHVDNGLALPGVFKHLNSIQKGADVYVVDEKGNRIHFIVTDITSYDYKDGSASGKIFGNTGKSLIRLVTCTGDWVGGDKTYDKRLVVTAELAT